MVEAAVRAMIYVRMAEGQIDERAFNTLQQIAAEHAGPKIGFSRFKEIVREQYLMLLLHQERAVAARYRAGRSADEYADHH